MFGFDARMICLASSTSQAPTRATGEVMAMARPPSVPRSRSGPSWRPCLPRAFRAVVVRRFCILKSRVYVVVAVVGKPCCLVAPALASTFFPRRRDLVEMPFVRGAIK